ncbi:Shedu anti-phage system protein SduA domain-containing protein [Pedobacter sp. GR22-6]|uniref:Shedu anti-phage system protein SduA domain-containing protein n=1 Tax=Pedobacter sp. GR22-6 TaxID=3127957 RepID=UPI00307F2091
MLYQRDYRILTAEEQASYDQAQAMANKIPDFSTDDLFDFHEMMPAAGYYYESLFPNNFLSTEALEDVPLYEAKLAGYEKVISDPKSRERDALNYIKNEESYFIIASMLKTGFWFGHHEAYLFKEFELPPHFKADYVIVGKNSGGYEFVFVELESIYGQITKGDGDLGTCFRAGLAQIDDWDTYIEANFSTINLVFEKAKMPGVILRDEFRKLDKTRIHYAVVAGRRSDFNDKTRRIQRQHREQGKTHLFHYDNLIDSANSLIKEGNY